jgi:protein CpxP
MPVMSKDSSNQRPRPLQRFTPIDSLFTAKTVELVFLFYVEPKVRKFSFKDQEEIVKSGRSIFIVAAAGLAIAAGIAFAQTEGGPMHHQMHGGMHGHRMGGPEFAMFLHQLNLTDEQKAQVKQIFQTEKPAVQPLHQQEGQLHIQMMKLVASDKFDPKAAAALASQESQVHMQMEVEHAKIGSQIYQLLSSDQKAKVADMISKHEQMMQQHLQKEQSGAPEQQ